MSVFTIFTDHVCLLLLPMCKLSLNPTLIGLDNKIELIQRVPLNGFGMHSHIGTFSIHKSVKDKNFNHIHSLERLFLKPARYVVMSVQSIHHLRP